MTPLETIGRLRVVPVVVLDRVEDAAPLADALQAAGLPCMEITFRTEAAEAAIRSVADRSELLVGAGTVLSVEQAQRAVDAGARFLVSPGIAADVVEWAADQGVPITPGIATPTDLTLATALGLEVVKFFPAEAYGGLKTLKALAGPFPAMKFVPTGGLNADNYRSYLAHPRVHAIGGSWMVKGEWIREGRFDEIERVSRAAVEVEADR